MQYEYGCAAIIVSAIAAIGIFAALAVVTLCSKSKHNHDCKLRNQHVDSDQRTLGEEAEDGSLYGPNYGCDGAHASNGFSNRIYKLQTASAQERTPMMNGYQPDAELDKVKRECACLKRENEKLRKTIHLLMRP